MSNINFSRMFRGKVRSNTCRIILITSLVWLLIDIILIMHYSDCIGNGWSCRKSNEYDVEVSTVFFLFLFYCLCVEINGLHIIWNKHCFFYGINTIIKH